MNKYFTTSGIGSGVFPFLVFCVCLIYTTPSSGQSTRELLLESNEIQRTAHLENDATLLVSQIAESMINVDKGEINTLSNDQIRTRFEKYFKLVKYTKWDDVQDPIIQSSDDQQWAVMFVQKFLDLQYRDQNGDLGEHHYALFAWESQYRKIDGKWKIVSITSTDKSLTKEEAVQFK